MWALVKRKYKPWPYKYEPIQFPCFQLFLLQRYLQALLSLFSCHAFKRIIGGKGKRKGEKGKGE